MLSYIEFIRSDYPKRYEEKFAPIIKNIIFISLFLWSVLLLLTFTPIFQFPRQQLFQWTLVMMILTNLIGYFLYIKDHFKASIAVLIIMSTFIFNYLAIQTDHINDISYVSNVLVLWACVFFIGFKETMLVLIVDVLVGFYIILNNDSSGVLPDPLPVLISLIMLFIGMIIASTITLSLVITSLESADANARNLELSNNKLLHTNEELEDSINRQIADVSPHKVIPGGYPTDTKADML